MPEGSGAGSAPLMLSRKKRKLEGEPREGEDPLKGLVKPLTSADSDVKIDAADGGRATMAKSSRLQKNPKRGKHMLVISRPRKNPKLGERGRKLDKKGLIKPLTSADPDLDISTSGSKSTQASNPDLFSSIDFEGGDKKDDYDGDGGRATRAKSSRLQKKPKLGSPEGEDIQGQKVDVEEEEEEEEDSPMTEEELKRWWEKWWEDEEEDPDRPESPLDVVADPVIEKKDEALWERYLKQINDSDGYDIIDFPGITLLTPITPLFDFKQSPSDFESISACTEAAIKKFNSTMEEDDQFEVYDILTVNVSGSSTWNDIYYITFEAKKKNSVFPASTDVEDDQGRAPLLTTFQARVIENYEAEKLEVQECRIKVLKPSPP